MAFEKTMVKNNLTVRTAYAGTSQDEVFATATAKIDPSATVAQIETVARALANLQKTRAGITPSAADIGMTKRYLLQQTA